MERSLTRYDGAMSSEVRIQLTDLILAVAVANIGKRANIKKLCSIAVELLDNAQRYCAEGNVNFAWELQEDTLLIRIENQANERDAQRLMEAVNAVNLMTPEELAAAFKAQLTNGEFGERGGAGLGFLDIARRSKGAIEARIVPMENGNYLCSSSVATTLTPR